jgi:hypothetical protein
MRDLRHVNTLQVVARETRCVCVNAADWRLRLDFATHGLLGAPVAAQFEKLPVSSQKT